MTTHSSSPVAKRHAQAGQWRTPAATFPHPLTFELDGDSVITIVTKEKLSTRTRKKKYRHYLMQKSRFCGCQGACVCVDARREKGSISGFHMLFKSERLIGG